MQSDATHQSKADTIEKTAKARLFFCGGDCRCLDMDAAAARALLVFTNSSLFFSVADTSVLPSAGPAATDVPEPHPS